MIQNIGGITFGIGTFSFLIGLGCFIIAFYPTKRGYIKGIFIRTMIVMISCTIITFLIVYRGAKNSAIDIVGVFLYMTM